MGKKGKVESKEEKKRKRARERESPGENENSKFSQAHALEPANPLSSSSHLLRSTTDRALEL